jgi:phosphoribosyl 1,2-cyclic phosphodiesterase
MQRRGRLLRVKLWGTRGSLPRAQDISTDQSQLGQKGLYGIVPFSFGGATTCTEVMVDSASTAVFVDSGSGIAYASSSVNKRGIKKIHLLQTHFHWDHIMGFPFFTPIYDPKCHIVIHSIHRTAEEDLKILFNGRNFPLNWSDLSAKIEFKRETLYQSFQIAEHTITPFALDHPGGSFGYRVDTKGESFMVAVDSEFKRHTPTLLAKDLAYYKNLGTMLFDAQYDENEIESKHDWGHCTPHKGIDLAVELGIANLIFTHHDPMRDEAGLYRMYQEALEYLDKKNKATTKLFMAFDHMEFGLKNGVLSLCSK